MALVLFSYVNPILRYGAARAADDARAAGIVGSALVRAAETAGDLREDAVAALASSLRAACAQDRKSPE